MRIYPARREQEGSLLSFCHHSTIFCLAGQSLSLQGNSPMSSILSECNSAVPNFSQHPCSWQPTYPFNYSHKYQDFGSKGEKDWLAGWHNNSRKQSGVWEAEQMCGHMGWCNEKQNFLTPEPCDPLKPWNPSSLFLAEFPPKPHTKFCTHTHTPTTSTLPPAPAFLLTIWTLQVRAVCLGSIEQVSCVISQCFIHTDYCWEYVHR